MLSVLVTLSLGQAVKAEQPLKMSSSLLGTGMSLLAGKPLPPLHLNGSLRMAGNAAFSHNSLLGVRVDRMSLSLFNARAQELEDRLKEATGLLREQLQAAKEQVEIARRQARPPLTTAGGSRELAARIKAAAFADPDGLPGNRLAGCSNAAKDGCVDGAPGGCTPGLADACRCDTLIGTLCVSHGL